MPVNQLLSDFPDDEFNIGKRIVQANITEVDEIVVNIRMVGGEMGTITIKGTTLAQIIMDRNIKAAKADASFESADDGSSIDVGDGLGGEDRRSEISNIVDADELLAASKKRLPSGVTGGIQPRRFP